MVDLNKVTQMENNTESNMIKSLFTEQCWLKRATLHIIFPLYITVHLSLSKIEADVESTCIHLGTKYTETQS